MKEITETSVLILTTPNQTGRLEDVERRLYDGRQMRMARIVIVDDVVVKNAYGHARRDGITK